MKVIKVKKRDIESGEILDRLEELSRIVRLTSLRIDKDIYLNFAGRSYSVIEKEIEKLLSDSRRLFEQANQAKKYLTAVKNEVQQLQKQVKNNKVLNG